MKTCPNCNAEVDDNFNLCWNCRYNFDDEKILDQSDSISICPNCNLEVKPYLKHCPYCHYDLREPNQEIETKSQNNKHIECLRCKVVLDYQGNFTFNDGSRSEAAGNFLEIFINNESFDIYSCPNCGKVEFFLPGCA